MPPASASGASWPPPESHYHALRGIQALHDAMDHMVSRMRRDMDINPSDLRALRMMSVRELRGVPVTPQDISEHLGVTTAATTAVVNRLINHGYVTRSVHPEDARSRVLHLTPAANEDFFRHFKGHLGVMQQTIQQFSEPEIVTIGRFLDQMAQQLEAAMDPPSAQTTSGKQDPS